MRQWRFWQKPALELPDTYGWGPYQEEALAFAKELFKYHPEGSRVARENAFVTGADWAISRLKHPRPRAKHEEEAG